MRLDALEGAVRYVVERLDFDTKVLIEAKRRKEYQQGMNAWKDPVSRRAWMTDVCVAYTPQHKVRNRFGTPSRKRF